MLYQLQSWGSGEGCVRTVGSVRSVGLNSHPKVLNNPTLPTVLRIFNFNKFTFKYTFGIVTLYLSNPMRKKLFSHRLKALEPEKKVLAIASFASIVACFLPWYGINSRVINEWWNAFSSIGSVAGYVITIFSLFSLGMIAIQLLKPEWNIQQKIIFKEPSLLLFLSAQSFFVTLLFIPVYAQYSLINASNSGTRFGIYIALASTLVSSIVSFAYMRRMEKNASIKSDFATIPRAHRAVNDWEENETSEIAHEEIEQETMFDQYSHQQPEEYVESTEQENEYHQIK